MNTKSRGNYYSFEESYLKQKSTLYFCVWELNPNHNIITSLGYRGFLKAQKTKSTKRAIYLINELGLFMWIDKENRSFDDLDFFKMSKNFLPISEFHLESAFGIKRRI